MKYYPYQRDQSFKYNLHTKNPTMCAKEFLICSRKSGWKSISVESFYTNWSLIATSFHLPTS